jgi:HEAT repeat protein
MLESPDSSVRAAALQAMGALGTSADVALLAAKTGSDTEQESQAAFASLIRLRGDDVNAAVIAALEAAEPRVRTALLNVLAARDAKEAISAVLEQAQNPEVEIRLAALAGLRILAEAKDAPVLVTLVNQSQTADERWHAELALRALCARQRDVSVQAIMSAFATANAETQVVLLRCLARAGGEQALQEIVAQLNSPLETVRAEAVRMVSAWPDGAAVPYLLQLADKQRPPRDSVLAIRGLVRLATSPEDGTDFDLLRKALQAASRDEEKRLILGALGSTGNSEALSLVGPLLDDPAVRREACLAAIMVLESQPYIADAKSASVLAHMRAVAPDDSLRERAERIAK